MRLLLLEDDAILGEGLRDYLRAEGHLVDWFTRIRDTGVLEGEPYDALLVDWQLPDGSGVDWLRDLRRRGIDVPLLLLTARDRLTDRIHGLDSGADDYLVKPFAPEELVARIRAVRRRHGGVAAAQLRVGDIAIDLGARAVFVGGRRTELTAREWALVEALALRPGRIVDKSDLERLVAGDDALQASSNALEVHVSSVRRKLGRAAIETVRGLGYRLTPGP